jgi:hypothetical protein
MRAVPLLRREEILMPKPIALFTKQDKEKLFINLFSDVAGARQTEWLRALQKEGIRTEIVEREGRWCMRTAHVRYVRVRLQDALHALELGNQNPQEGLFQ